MSKGGYPDGARWTPVPDLFFSRDLPALDDPVALRVMLHVLWRTHRRKPGEPAAVRADDLAADPTLRRSVAGERTGAGDAAVGAGDAIDPAAEAITTALDTLIARALLIEVRVAGAGGPERWVMVNGREGRALKARLAAGDLALPDLPPAVAPPDAEPANVFALFERNIGLLTPMLAEELREAEAAYPADWIADAIRLAVQNNVRKWTYARAILERWAREGREGSDDAIDRRDHGRAGRRATGGRYAAFVEH